MCMYIILFFFLGRVLGTCRENCNAYSIYINTPTEYSAYNMFYLYSGNRTGCKHCYFDVNAYNSHGNYYFDIGLYDPHTTIFTDFARGTLSATTGFDICGISGYCAVWFSVSFTSFTLQTIPLENDRNNSLYDTNGSIICNYNSTYCTGNVPGYISFGHISPSFFDYYEDCAL